MTRPGRDRLRSRAWWAEHALVLVVVAVLFVLPRFLPHEGWGDVLRWVLGAAGSVILLLGLAGLLLEAGRQFRRGWRGETDGGA